MLMNLKTLEWDDHLCKYDILNAMLDAHTYTHMRNNTFCFHRFFGVPLSILPQIKSSSENFGKINQGCLKNVPITAVCCIF